MQQRDFDCAGSLRKDDAWSVVGAGTLAESPVARRVGSLLL